MNMLVRVLLFVLALLLGIISIIAIAFPFEKVEFLSIENIIYLLDTLKGNYVLSVVGLVLLLLSLRVLLLCFRTKVRGKEKISYVVNMNEYGEVKISSDTIIGLVHHVCNRITGIKNVKVKVDILEGQLYINLDGEVAPEINIPEVTNNLQVKVKENVESCTGVNVSEVRVFISNVTMPTRNLK